MWENPSNINANVLDCGPKENEFGLQSHHYVHFLTYNFWKGMNPLIPPVMAQIVSLLLFYKDSFDIK